MRVKKKQLLDFIRNRGAVTFPEIESFFRQKRYDFEGTTAIKLKSGPVLWHGWTHNAAREFLELYQESKIELVEDELAPVPPPRWGEGEVTYQYRRVIVKAG